MPATEDFLQTPDGDWDLSGPDLQVTPTPEVFAKQSLSETLQFWQGENYLNLLEGFPYFGVLGEKADRGLLQALYRTAALKTPGVGGVDAVLLTFDGPSRELSVRMQVRPPGTGEAVDVGPFIVGRPGSSQ